jgi:hypothetical protein
MKAHGRVIDAFDKEPLPSAKIFIADANGELVKPMKSVTSDDKGNFSIEVMPQDYLYVTYVGFYDKSIPVTEFSSKRKMIPLKYKDEVKRQVVNDRVVKTDYGKLEKKGMGFWGWTIIVGTIIFLYERHKRKNNG